MKGPTAWLVTRKDGQDEKYIQLEFPIVNLDIYTTTPLYSHPTAMQSIGLETVRRQRV